MSDGSIWPYSATRRGQRGKFHCLQEGNQFAGVGFMYREFIQRHIEYDLVVEQNKLT